MTKKIKLKFEKMFSVGPVPVLLTLKLHGRQERTMRVWSHTFSIDNSRKEIDFFVDFDGLIAKFTNS